MVDSQLQYFIQTAVVDSHLHMVDRHLLSSKQIDTQMYYNY